MTSHGLEVGRWPATLAEIEATFVVGQHPVRSEIWAEFVALVEAFQDCTGHIAAMWLGGSFLTGKTEPGDIDCVFVVEWPHLAKAKADPDRAAFLGIVARSLVKDHFQLRVDSFVLEWIPTPGPGRGLLTEPYLGNRGYWDDLWSRARSNDDREDSLIRRGYLEVIVDGYQ